MDFLLALTIILSPAYSIHFKLLGFPTDVLMFWVVLLWLIFVLYLILARQMKNFIAATKNINKYALLFSSLFLLAGLFSIFAEKISRETVGQFIVLFLQPLSIFLVGNYFAKKSEQAASLIKFSLYWLTGAAGLYAIMQYTYLIGLPVDWWGNSVEPKRAVSFFVHPNFYALWNAPLLAFLIPDLGSKIDKLKTNLGWFLLWLLGVAGLILSLSRAGWLGLAAAIIIYAIVAADSKIRKFIFSSILFVAIIVLSVPNLRWRLLLPFYGEKSAVSRTSLWTTGIKAVKESPIFGIGLTGFSQQWTSLNTDPNLDTHNFPHNIFLDFWVEAGLLGLISFVCVSTIFIYRGLKNKTDSTALAIALFLIALIFSGLVDNPYFKNDLAMVFWLILSLAA